jgi:hypothetical protein
LDCFLLDTPSLAVAFGAALRVGCSEDGGGAMRRTCCVDAPVWKDLKGQDTKVED